MTQIRRIVKQVKKTLAPMPKNESEMPFPEKYAVYHGKRTRLPRLTQTFEVAGIEKRPCPACKTVVEVVQIKKLQQYSQVTEGQEPPLNQWIFQRRYLCPSHPNLIEDCWEVEILEGRNLK